MFVIDFKTESLVGAKPPRVIRAGARKLNNKLPGVRGKYVRALEKLLRDHNIPQRLQTVDLSSQHKAVVKEETDKIDSEQGQYMAHAEKKCRRIKSGRIPFSDEAAVWIRRRQVYHSILKYHDGKIRNRANLKRAARRCGIDRALSISVKEVRERLKVCEAKCDYFAKHGQRYRKKFLQKRLTVARAKRNAKAEKEILELIEREKQRAFWRRLNYSMRKKSGGSVRVVQVADDDGQVTEITDQQEVEQEIWRQIHGKRFYLAEQAPICQGRLRGEFGYLANTRAAEEVLAGTYEAEEEVDVGTQGLFDKIAEIRGKIPKDSVDTLVKHPVW
jgi:hypothetical protein